MGLRERFEEIEIKRSYFIDGVCCLRRPGFIQDMLNAVCADRIEQGGDHDWPMEINDDPFLRHFDDPPKWEITGPCRLCGEEMT